MQNKRLVLFGLLCGVLVAMAFCLLPKRNIEEAPTIVVTNFAAYDLARAVLADESKVEMLLAPGAELHNFEPSPQDVEKIREAQLLIYNGGESELWVERILDDDNGHDVISAMRLMDYAQLKDEELVEGMVADEEESEDEEYDEHVWTSPQNMVVFLDALLAQARDINLEVDEAKATEYRNELVSVDKELRDVVANAARKEIVVADRFPFRYLVDELGLEYRAAYPGCSESTEVNAATLAYLANYVREHRIMVVLKTELSSGKVAEALAHETGVEIRELHAAHNISRDDFEAGVTYADLMKRNVTVLQEALN